MTMPNGQSALLTVLFLVVCVQLGHLVWAWDRRHGRTWRAVALWAAALLAVLALLLDGAWPPPVPLWLLWGGTIGSGVGGAAVLCAAVRRARGQIGRASIKEAMDDLPAAVCWTTARGAVKLCDRQMERLYREMDGRDLQSLDELHAAAARCAPDGTYRAADGRVWQYAERTVTAEGRRYTETRFTDVTAFTAVNEALAQDNAELARVNAKLKKLYERAKDHVREREYLAFKLKIHDEIGQGLAVLRRAMREGGAEEADLARQMSALSLAAGTLVYAPDADSPDPYDVLLSECRDLGVALRLDGAMPVEPTIEDLVVKAMRACVSNCVRHAHGTTVSVRIRGVAGGYTVQITNDGAAPAGPIVEGVGLTALRRSIETAGGEMRLAHRPGFLMSLTFLREEMDL